MFTDLFNLFFPRTCICCDSTLLPSENQICINCLSRLSLTNFVDIVNNPVEKIFWGRSKIEAATALLYFKKNGNTQKILHEIKYKNNIKAAHLMGNLLGIELKKSKRFENIDIIIPVPLHYKKKKKRGYNQSEEIAKGIAKHFSKEIVTDCLVRKEYTKTQTKKNRLNRWENVSNSFAVANPDIIKGKHVLFIDDVVTTGATLETCANTLLAIPTVKVSIASLSIAYN